MSGTTAQTQAIHLVGSVPLSTSEEVFRAVAGAIGNYVERIPDGETGDRLDWIVWQGRRFEESPDFERVTEPQTDRYRGLPRYKLRPGVSGGPIRLSQPGYASAAKDSYRTFARLKREGVIPAHCKFQLSLPTPVAPLRVFVDFLDNMAVEPVYEELLLGELDEIIALVPPGELAVQWDVSVEMSSWEGVYAPRSTWMEDRLIEMLARIGDHVPAAVDLGYHLCYGDANHKHWKEPEDTTHLVEVANRITERVSRHIQWVHMPVPQNRADDAYFVPLRGLRLTPTTRLFLGLLHLTDGAEGAERRANVARKHVAEFGIGTECGFGRRPAATIPALLELHRQVAARSLSSR